MYTFYYLIDYTMSNKKSPNFNSSNPSEAPRSWWKGKVKNVALATAVAATLLSGSGCWKTKTYENPRWTKHSHIEVYGDISDFHVEKDSAWNYTINVKIGDEEKKVKAPTNDINGVWYFDGVFYYSCVIEWEDWQGKSFIFNEKWDTIISWLDYIGDWIVNKWNFAVVWGKDRKLYYIYNGNVVDEWCDDYKIQHFVPKDRIYAHGLIYGKNESNAVFFNDGEKLPYSFTYSPEDKIDVDECTYMREYGNSYVIIDYGSDNKDTRIIYGWKIISKDVDWYTISRANNLLSYEKCDQKGYVLTKDGREIESECD